MKKIASLVVSIACFVTGAYMLYRREMLLASAALVAGAFLLNYGLRGKFFVFPRE